MCLLGSVIVVGLVSPASAARSSDSRSATISSLLVKPSCPAASLLNSHLGSGFSFDVNLHQPGGVGCEYGKRLGASYYPYSEVRIYLQAANGETNAQFDASPPAVEGCIKVNPCVGGSLKATILKGVGISADYGKEQTSSATVNRLYSGIWMYVLERGWLNSIVFPRGAQGVQGGLQSALAKAESLMKALILPIPPAPTPTTIPTTALITGLNCSGICAFAIGGGQVVLSWPDSGATEYTLAIYLNGTLSVNEAVGGGYGNPPTVHGGQEYWEFTPSKGLGAGVFFEYFAGADAYATGTWAGSAMSNSVVVK